MKLRRPDTKRITLKDGTWLLVKKHLNAREQRNVYAGSIAGGQLVQGERPKIDPKKVGIAQIAEYLIDWSVTDPQGAIISLATISDDEKYTIIGDLDPEDLIELMAAIQKHDADMEAERAAEKNDQAGVTTSSAILESVG